MAESNRAYTRSQTRAKLIVALTELNDLYNDHFGYGSEEGEDADALGNAIGAIDDVLEALGEPDDEDEGVVDGDEAAQVDEGGFVDRQ